MMKSVIPHDTIPERLKTLLAKHDFNYTEATLAAGYKKTSVPVFRRIAMGEAVLGPVVKARIDAALHGKDPRAAAAVASGIVRAPITAAKVAAGALKQAKTPPPGVKINKGRPWRSGKKLTDYPPMLRELIVMYRGNIKAASIALGFKSVSWINKFAEENAPLFTEEDEARVRAALNDPVVPSKAKKAKKASTKKTKANGVAHDEDSEIDAGELGIAIVLSTANVLESLYDAGEAMGGEWVFKKRVGKQWLSVCRLDPQELQAFRSIARVIAIEVATP
jgi:hypothetical protein